MKHIILIILIFFIFTAVHAQIGFGGRLGMNFMNVSEDGKTYTDYLVGAHIGVVMQYIVTPDIIVQPEMLKTEKGYQGEWNGLREDFSFDCLEFPVLAKYIFAAGRFSLQPFIGPAISFISKKDRYEGMADREFSLHMGLDAVYNDLVALGFRYNYGLTSITEDQDLKFRSLLLSLSMVLF